MSPQEERRLVLALSSPDQMDEAERNQLVQKHVVPWAKSVARRWPGGQREDLEQAAMLAICRAARRWDSEGAPFDAYARIAAAHAVKREYFAQGAPVAISDRRRKLQHRARKVHSRLEQVLHRSPSLEEVARELDRDQHDVATLLHPVVPSSLDTVEEIRATGHPEDRLLDAITETDEKSTCPIEKPVRSVSHRVRQSDLTPRQRQAVILRLSGPGGSLMPLREVARQMGNADHSSVVRLLDRAIRRLEQVGKAKHPPNQRIRSNPTLFDPRDGGRAEKGAHDVDND